MTSTSLHGALLRARGDTANHHQLFCWVPTTHLSEKTCFSGMRDKFLIHNVCPWIRQEKSAAESPRHKTECKTSQFSMPAQLLLFSRQGRRERTRPALRICPNECVVVRPGVSCLTGPLPAGAIFRLWSTRGCSSTSRYNFISKAAHFI